jgi:hypothetical protein
MIGTPLKVDNDHRKVKELRRKFLSVSTSDSEWETDFQQSSSYPMAVIHYDELKLKLKPKAQKWSETIRVWMSRSSKKSMTPFVCWFFCAMAHFWGVWTKPDQDQISTKFPDHECLLNFVLSQDVCSLWHSRYTQTRRLSSDGAKLDSSEFATSSPSRLPRRDWRHRAASIFEFDHLLRMVAFEAIDIDNALVFELQEQSG